MTGGCKAKESRFDRGRSLRLMVSGGRQSKNRAASAIGLDAKQLGNLDQNNYSASAEFQERGGQNHVIRMIGSSTQAILLVRSTEQLS